MKRAVCLAVTLLLAPAPAHAQTIVGQAVAVDGDTLEMTGFRVRLFGIDAVESGQSCLRDGQPWACGREAREVLAQLVDGQPVQCEQRDTDVYGRIVGVCRAGRVDLSQAMASGGYAVALSDFSADYVPAADAARARRAGIWGSEFAEPAAYRAANPRSEPQQRAAREADASPRALMRPAPVAAAGVYYRNCNEARAAGAAPLYRGQPGYRPEMDGDSDGIACEPYRGRR